MLNVTTKGNVCGEPRRSVGRTLLKPLHDRRARARGSQSSASRSTNICGRGARADLPWRHARAAAYAPCGRDLAPARRCRALPGLVSNSIDEVVAAATPKARAVFEDGAALMTPQAHHARPGIAREEAPPRREPPQGDRRSHALKPLNPNKIEERCRSTTAYAIIAWRPLVND
jgi:hypothetical protein